VRRERNGKTGKQKLRRAAALQDVGEPTVIIETTVNTEVGKNLKAALEDMAGGTVFFDPTPRGFA
jgi:hypothetical protein